MFASPIGAGTEMTQVMHEKCNPISRQDDMDVDPTTSQSAHASASTGINILPVDVACQDRPLEMELADVEAFRVEPPLGESHHSSPLHDGPLEQQSVTQGPSLQAGMKCTRDQQSTPTSPMSPELSPPQQHESRLLLGPLGSPICLAISSHQVCLKHPMEIKYGPWAENGNRVVAKGAFGLLTLTHHPSNHIKFQHPHIHQSAQA